MKRSIDTLRTLLLLAFLAAPAILTGCDAAAIAGPDQAIEAPAETGDGDGNGDTGDSHGETKPRNI